MESCGWAQCLLARAAFDLQMDCFLVSAIVATSIGVAILMKVASITKYLIL